MTHHRARLKTLSAAAHERRLDANFEITAEQYQALYESQGGKCFICRKSTGKTKRLAVEHDHTLALEHGHDPAKGCPRCIRCLACGRCNRLIAFLDVEALQRAIVVLTDPPARKLLCFEQGESILTTDDVNQLANEAGREFGSDLATAIPPTIAEVDEAMDCDALDEHVSADDFWATEADSFWTITGTDPLNASDNFWLAPVSE